GASGCAPPWVLKQSSTTKRPVSPSPSWLLLPKSKWPEPRYVGKDKNMLSRRAFLRTSLQTSTLVALAPTVPGFLAQTARAASAERDGRILVLIQLAGGHARIHPVVP